MWNDFTHRASNISTGFHDSFGQKIGVSSLLKGTNRNYSEFGSAIFCYTGRVWELSRIQCAIFGLTGAHVELCFDTRSLTSFRCVISPSCSMKTVCKICLYFGNVLSEGRCCCRIYYLHRLIGLIKKAD